jgi:hypothetical protein
MDTKSKIPPASLDVGVLDLAHLYAAHVRDRTQGTHLAPDFADAVRIHQFIDRISRASATGVVQPVHDIWALSTVNKKEVKP